MSGDRHHTTWPSYCKRLVSEQVYLLFVHQKQHCKARKQGGRKSRITLEGFSLYPIIEGSSDTFIYHVNEARKFSATGTSSGRRTFFGFSVTRRKKKMRQNWEQRSSCEDATTATRTGGTLQTM